MKKQTIILSLLTIICFLTSCSENDEFNGVLDRNAQQTTNVISGTGTLNFGDLEKVLMNVPQTRTATHYVNGGLNYGWKKGERVPVYMYYKQGDKQAVIENEVVFGDFKKLTFKTKIPKGFYPRRGDLYVAAIMRKQPNATNGAWASGFTEDGKIKIESTRTIDPYSDHFNLPFYTPLSLVRSNGTATLNFELLGSWIAATMNVPKSIDPQEVVINSDVVSTSGTVDFSTSLGKEPSWTPASSQNGNIKYGVNKFRVRANEDSKPLLIWFMPNTDKKSQKPTTVKIGYHAVERTKLRYLKTDTNGKAFNFRKQKVYTFEFRMKPSDLDSSQHKGLVITQFWSTRKNRYCNRNLLQITNISDHEISLEGYYLVRSVFGSADKASGVIDLGKLEENNAQFLYNDRKKKVLPSGASLLITGFTRRVARGTFDRCKGQVYQIALLGEDANLLRQFVPQGNRDCWGRESNCHFCNAYFLTYNGTDISLSKPNDIVDNFGRDACGRIYNFQFCNRTYYRVPYCYIYMGEQGLGGYGTHLYKPERRIGRYAGSYWGPMENFSTCSWRIENENKITSLGFWGKYGDIYMFRNNMY